MTRQPKITFIGAGSTVFMKNVIGDVLQRPSLSGATIALMDVNPQRLEESEIVAGKLVKTLGAAATIETHSSQRKALEGADFVVVAFQIGGYEPCTVTDFEVPKKYGLRQTIADTLGVGGIMRGLRTVPHLWKICEDMMAICPDAILLQYVNPMAINTWAIAEKYPLIKQVGLCHSVQGTAFELARDLEIPLEEIRYRAAGINHMAFYLRFEHNGQDLYPRLRQVMEQRAYGRRYRGLADHVRYEVLRRTGYFVTESSEHFSEYVPWFIKAARPELIERFNIPLDEYPRRCERQIAKWEALRTQLESSAEPIEATRSTEYAAGIIHSLETGQPRTIYGNVANAGLIDNLPPGCCVEVPCLVDRAGVQPTHIGALPPHLAALIQTNINVQALTVEAALTSKREHIYHAAMLDPHTAAELDLDQIWALVDELLAAHGAWVPTFR